ncbi:hypothetical protein SDC9_89955 [bioreactor metagenome]|uniref:Uncharacterized protein n=1 Tax=bioreactor metagenome TaxID=1076179 RepID=A0A644ZR01_9ZZZZ
MIDFCGICKKGSLDMPHQRVGTIHLLAETFFGYNGVCALRHLVQLQQHLALRLKHLFVRALYTVDAQRDGHTWTELE